MGEDAQRALLNILKDSEEERRRLEDAQRALLNILKDSEEERCRLKEAQRALERANALQGFFVAALSHDLRNDLIGMTALLEAVAGRLTAAGLDATPVTETLRSAHRVARMAEDLLDLIQFQHGSTEVKRDEVDLRELVVEAVSTVDDHTHPIAVDVPPMTVVVDAVKVERAIRSLVQNAIIYTARGTPISVRADAEGDRLVLVVDDAGDGVPEHLRERIFELFTRGEHGGFGKGVGLAHVAQVAAVHDGRAWVEDRDGGGASFRLALTMPGRETEHGS